ncbi:J domain-containing protein [Flavihumibacter petaseus]|nr:J domain-containing protein [Flavihumibacter petaseus]
MRMEVERLGGKDLIVSTNLRVRKDGLLYADELNRRIDDPGVAIYFKYKGKVVAMCADQYLRIWENMYALGKGIEALRGMERWGVSEFLDRAFTGFTALPEATPGKDIWGILGLSSRPEYSEIVRVQYRKLAKERHPDQGGSDAAFQELVDAFNRAIQTYE